MEGRKFRPEMTAPLIDREVLRLKLVALIYKRYPAQCKDLLAAWPLFDALVTEEILSLKDTGVFSSGDYSLDSLHLQGIAIGCGELLGKLISWAKFINLPYVWVVAAGLWAFRTMQLDESAPIECLSLRLQSAFEGAQINISSLPAQTTTHEGGSGVILPRFTPTQQSEEEYRAECKKILDEYILREHRAHRKIGLSRPTPAPSEDEHLKWLAITLVEGLSTREVAQRVSGEQRCTFQAVAKALKSMAGRIGVNLEQIRRS